MTIHEKNQHLGFHYQISKQQVDIYRNGTLVTTLRGSHADRFLARATDKSEAEQQQLMARTTGNYKRGNERHAKQHSKRR